MSSNARRSERLRRKRQSTPGLSQPGAYSLYGSGYVVESEASFLPPSLPPHARHLRYKDSPHIFADHSPTQPLPSPNTLPHPDHPPATPPAKDSLVDRVRLSLFDILGSEARRPVRNHWRALRPSAPDEPQQQQDHPEDLFVDDHDTPDHHPASAHPPSATRRRLLPLALLAALLLASLPLLLALDSLAHPRAAYYRRATRSLPAWRSLRAACSSLPSAPSLPSPSVPALPALTRLAAPIRTALRFLFRGAWSTPLLTAPPHPADYVSRADLEARIIPDLLSAARAAAVEEATRVSRDLAPPSAPASGSFASFAEQYAADKGLPADYALLSVGAAVVASEPSASWMYSRFVRQYVEALVKQGSHTPLLPNRPQTALTPDVLPGNCWAFPGERGSLTIRLARPVRPSAVTIEHTPSRSVFSTLSAPRRFRVFGVPVRQAVVGTAGMVELGEFVFDMQDGKEHLQTFALEGGEEVGKIRAVKVEILSNHGAPHTSLYRVRVHGKEVEKDAE